MSPMNVLAAIAAATCFAAPAGAYDPAKDSPFTLLQAPADAVGYFATREQARRLWREGKAAEAEPLLERLVREYPRDAWNWMTLGRVKARLGKPGEAARANEQAGPLVGWGAVEFPIGYRLAANKLAAGDRGGALDTLRWLIREQAGYHRGSLFAWEDFAPLRTDPEFLALIGRADAKGWTREEGWRHDIAYLLEETKRVNPTYRHQPFPEEVQRRREALERDVPTLSDEQVYMGLRRMLAPLRQGHIAFQPLRGTRFLPVRFYAFPEGIYIVEAHEPYRDLAGARVLAFGALAADEAWRRLSQARSTDGDMEQPWNVYELAATAVLKGLGATEAHEKIELTVERRDGAVGKVVLESSPRFPAQRQDRLVAPPGVPAPLFLSALERTFWHVPLPERSAMYVQVNNIYDTPGESIAQYGKRLWADLAAARPANLVLDLRHNNGGNTLLYVELLRTVTAYARTPGNRVYVLIGRRTYSAAANLVTELERLAEPVFVGEATSECCRLHGDPTQVELPYSQLRGEVATVVWNLSSPGDHRREMSPHLPVQLTASAYFAGEDPAMEAVFRAIARTK